jgi:hypothetical protein
MDGWKRRGGKSQRRERVRRKKIQAPDKVAKPRVAKFVFSNVLWLHLRPLNEDILASGT